MIFVHLVDEFHIWTNIVHFMVDYTYMLAIPMCAFGHRSQ